MSGQTSLFGWQYMNPITDVQFVCSLDKVPFGYIPMQRCPNGRNGQLWHNEPGKEPETRYLCYTKENVCQDYVIEGMYIPSPDEPLLKKGYHVIGFTVEGEKPMRKHQLAIKKVPISKAKKVIVEVVVFRTEERQVIPKSYQIMEAVNGVHILYREAAPPTMPSAVFSSASESSRSSSSESASSYSSEDPLPKKPPPVSSALRSDQGRDATQTGTSAPLVISATLTGTSVPPLVNTTVTGTSAPLVPNTTTVTSAPPLANTALTGTSAPPNTVPNAAHQKVDAVARPKIQTRHLRLKEKSRQRKNRELEDHAVTDIVLVCSLDNVPPGYSVIKECASGHSAQLWDSSSAGRPGTRYLCYTKDKQEDDLVIENIYIPWPGESLRKDFRAIKHTIEGEVSMSQYQLTVQKVPREQASRVVVDIIICRQKEVKFVPSSYNRLYNVNDLRITFRTAPNIFRKAPNVSSQPQIKTDADPGTSSAQATNPSPYPPLRMPTSLQVATPLRPDEKIYLKNFLVHPITDVVLVRSLDNVPRGYTPIPHCVSTHSAQLWRQRTFRDRSETRYLCYTKEKLSDDRLIQDLHVLRSSEEVPSGYDVVCSTVEGDKALKQKRLAVKKLPRAVASGMVIDIMMCRKQDKHLVPQEYTTLASINDVHINFMVALMKDLRTKKQ